MRGCIYILTRRARLVELTRTLAKLHAHFLRDFPAHRVVIFATDFTPADEAALRAAMPCRNMAAQLRVLPVVLAAPRHMMEPAAGRAPHELEAELSQGGCAPHRVGYRAMCRFHAHEAHRLLCALSPAPPTLAAFRRVILQNKE